MSIGFDIATNINAMQAESNLNANALAFSKSVQQLSSGLRINSAADDAAGLAISDVLGAQVNGLNQASSNAQDGISMLQTADGAASQISAMVQQINQLAVQGSNDTLSTSDRQAIGQEMQQLSNQMSAIANQTNFNGQKLLTGSLSGQLDTVNSTAQAGTNLVAATNTSITAVDVSAAQAGKTFTFADSSTTPGQLTLSDGTNSQMIDISGLSLAAGQSTTLNFDKLGVKVTVSTVSGETGINIAAGLDPSLSGTVAGKTPLKIETLAGSGAANIQDGANASDNLSLAFATLDPQAAGVTNALTTLNTDIGSFNAVGGQTAANAQTLITDAANALTYVDQQRSNYGASINQLQYAINNLNTTSQNLSSSQAQILDTNVASTMVNFTNEQIIQQAGMAVLAQANQAPQSILKLFP